MPTYDPNKTYIASVFDGIILKLRLTIDEYPDIAVNVGISQGDPNGVVTGSPGDVRIDLVTPAIWQKMTGELDEFGWVIVGGGGGGGANPNDTFITYTANADLPNARVAAAGTNISFDLTTPGLFIINATGGAVTLQAALNGQNALGVPTTQAYSTRIQIGDTFSWQWEDQAGNDIVVIAGDDSAIAFSVQGGDTAAGAGQAISIAAGAGTVVGQVGGSVTITSGNATGAAAGDLVLVAGSGTPNGRVLVQPVWSGDGEALAIIGNGANGATSGIHAGSRDPNGSVTGHRGGLYMRNPGGVSAGAAYINTSITDTGTIWTQIATTSTVTLQAAIDGQGATPTEQTIVTSIDLNGGTGAWNFRDASNNPIFTIGDVVGVSARQQFAFDGAISPAALAAGNTDDYAPAGLATANALRLTGDAAGSTITGITGGASGRVLLLFNVGTTAITLAHDVTSAGANRFLLPDNTSLSIPTNGSVVIWYDSTTTRWRTAPSPGAPPQFNQPITTVGAGAGTLPIADLPNPGDRIVIRGLVVSSIFTAGAAAGDIGQIMFAGDVQAQNGTTDGVVVAFAPQPWGPPPGTAILQPTSTGYQPPLAFGSPGGLAIALNVVGTQIQITVTGIGGFTILTNVIGEIHTYGTAVRLVA